MTAVSVMKGFILYINKIMTVFSELQLTGFFTRGAINLRVDTGKPCDGIVGVTGVISYCMYIGDKERNATALL